MDAASNKRSRELWFKSHWTQFFIYLKKYKNSNVYKYGNKAIEANLSGLHSTSNQRKNGLFLKNTMPL